MRSKKELLENKESIERLNSGIKKWGINYPNQMKQGWYNCLMWVLKDEI